MIPSRATAAPAPAIRTRTRIQGAVQGVGFRPFIYRLAHELGLTGHVSNTPAGVTVEVEGRPDRVETFLARIETDKPPLSVIVSLETEAIAAEEDRAFTIRHSESGGDTCAHVLPDIATCPDCLREIRDPHDRRYRYPFTNCTNCGPRFTIIHRLPYDRPNTSMEGFTLCPACRAEYEDPRDRRFHAQPTACPDCGPRLARWDGAGRVLATRHDALRQTAAAIRAGCVVAVKGLGGFHLVVDARNDAAVRELHHRKQRREKPFALMYPNLEAVRADCRVAEEEARLLTAPEAPIVLLARRETAAVSPSVAPGAPDLGVMLPYTPLHHLLLEELGFPVVATSANLSEEPICIDEREALHRLAGLADCFLVHDRPIVRHVDDSIVRVVAGREMVLRRARGFAPLPIRTRAAGPDVLATGAHLKNTVAVARGKNVFISQHMGDLETPAALDAHTAGLTDLRELFAIAPQAVACDLHPDYLSSRHAAALGLPVMPVQHHYAHVVACMAEHGLEGPVLGVSWDGTGLGTDGTIWGGEFLRADLDGFERAAFLRPFRLPGGDAAAREPRRSALGMLYALSGDGMLEQHDGLPCLEAFTPVERNILLRLLRSGTNAPVTSSAGRLFDGVSALLGFHQVSAYEGQAAMALEYAARATEEAAALPVPVLRDTTLDWEPLLRRLLEGMRQGEDTARLARGFHVALAGAVVTVAVVSGLEKVLLTGGCFQNVLLTEMTIDRLRHAGFTPYWHHLLPPNDGGIAPGQALHAMHRLLHDKKNATHA